MRAVSAPPAEAVSALVEALSESANQMRVLQILKASFPEVPLNVVIEVGALAALGEGEIIGEAGINQLLGPWFNPRG